MPKKLILCDCAGSQPISSDVIAGAAGVTCSKVYSALCTREAGRAIEAMKDGDVVIACQQERARFEEMATSAGAPTPGFVDLRDRAGWSDEAGEAAPKMAALVAESLLSMKPTRTVDVVSEGLCLIVGPGDVVLPAAEKLADALVVTVLLTDASDLPLTRGYDVVVGELARVEGALGGFTVTIDALQELIPGGRGAFEMTEPHDGGVSTCDILLDLSGGTPFVPAPQKREGYLRADPRDPMGVSAVLTEAIQLVGTFEKPLYVQLDPMICAHSRAGQVGCHKCLDICPASAILPDGDHVSIDPMICAGCGECSAVCPSGAITYEAPPLAGLMRRIETLARIYREAGGGAPRLLVTDRAFGTEMIALAARFGRGLPADVIPLELPTISGFGHAEMLAALGCGFASVDVLLAPTTERDALVSEHALAEAIAGEGSIRLLDISDPEALPEALFDRALRPAVETPILPLGNRRQIARLSAQTLNPNIDAPLPLPVGAPYGTVLVNKDACTLCLSCVSLCPSGALVDNPDMPQLKFQEEACLQCGICSTICPESAITLEPRLDLSDGALSQRVLHEEEPFACIECGALFGVKSTVERITKQLAGKHSMFANPDASRMIQMCDDCRVKVQFKVTDNPMQGGPRPRQRTTDDYLARRRDH